MLSSLRCLAFFTAIDVAVAQLTTLSGTGSSVALTGDNGLPTGTHVTYLSFNSTMTLSTTNIGATDSIPTSSLTQLIGGSTIIASNTTTILGNATATSSSAIPTNTQPCNNYVEFCTRKYSNITMITAHNFPFVKQGNAESNQQYGVIDQLNDGVRMRECSLIRLEICCLIPGSSRSNAFCQQHIIFLSHFMRSTQCRNGSVCIHDYCEMGRRSSL